jgi:uncharacterized protein (DUF427 family)
MIHHATFAGVDRGLPRILGLLINLRAGLVIVAAQAHGGLLPCRRHCGARRPGRQPAHNRTERSHLSHLSPPVIDAFGEPGPRCPARPGVPNLLMATPGQTIRDLPASIGEQMGTITGKLRQMVGGGPPSGAVQAVWNGTVIAESYRTVKVEGNHYFPAEDVNRALLAPSDHRTTCPWMGRASDNDLIVDRRNQAAAWYYPKPSPAVRKINDHVAFWRGVELKRAPAV